MQKGGSREGRPGILIAIGTVALAAAAGVIVLRLTSDHGGEEPGLQAALLDWIVLSYVFSGLIAWRRRPDSRLGPLMIAAGFVTSLASLSSLNAAFPFTIGQAFDLVPIALFLHVFLSVPTGRLQGASERAVVGFGYFSAFGLQLIGLMLGGFRPDNVVAIVAEPAAAETLFKLELVSLSAASLAGIAVLVARRRQAPRPLRRSTVLLVDSFALALVMTAVMTFVGAFFPEWTAFITIQRVTFFVVGLAPIAFLIALLDARLARSSVGDLMVALRTSSAPADLQEPLSRALHDPSLTLAYWLPQYRAWTDSDGRPVQLPSPGDGRATTLIQRDGEQVAALIHDPTLEDEPELVEAVRAAAAIALENGQLQAELKARLEELEGSRARVIEAGQQERKRLERNLHDGAQQRLIALSLELGRLGSRLEDDPEARARVDEAKREIAVSLDELRSVARGLHPAVLSGHGLEVALESLVATSAVPVQVSVDLEGRLAEAVEVAAYYVVSESLANVGKHAHASSAIIEVAKRDAELVVEIVDDGIGGADSERGSGLRGLADRVEALGGRVRVWTPQGGGTRVRAELPCE